MNSSLTLAVAAALTLLIACAEPAPAGPTVTLTVAPLTLSGVTDARYQLEVRNHDGDVVMQRTLDSRSYGAGDGSLSFVGPCDASSNDNVLTLTLLDLYEGAAGSTVVDPATYRNPGALERPFTCLEGADVALDLNLTVARDAQQGFFDVAVTFNDVFCSAKLDCTDALGQPLALLFDASGARARTAVLALACTGGVDATETTLYHDDVIVTCTGGGSGGAGGVATVDASAGPGNVSVGAGVTDPQGLLFGAAVYRGEELLDYHKRYWNVLLGLTADAAHCSVVTRATATGEPFTANATPADTTYPFIVWDLPLTGADGVLACSHHPLGGAGAEAGVAIAYTGLSAPRTFARSFSGAPSLPATARASCQAHLAAGATTDGTYSVDPDGSGGVAPFDVACDMTTAGGGWTLVAVLTNADGTKSWGSDAAWGSASTFGTLASVGSADMKSPAFATLVATDVLFTAQTAAEPSPFDAGAGYWRQSDDALGGQGNLRNLFNSLLAWPTSACFAGSYSCSAHRAALTAAGPNGAATAGTDNAFGLAMKSWDYENAALPGSAIAVYYRDDAMNADTRCNAGGGWHGGAWSTAPDDVGAVVTYAGFTDGAFCTRAASGQLLIWLR